MEAAICACSCDYDDVPIDPYTQKWVKTRVPHKCLECGEEIPPGSRMLMSKGCVDHEYWFQDYTCEFCHKLFQDYGCCYGALIQDIWDSLGFNYVTGEWNPRVKEQDHV